MKLYIFNAVNECSDLKLFNPQKREMVEQRRLMAVRSVVPDSFASSVQYKGEKRKAICVANVTSQEANEIASNVAEIFGDFNPEGLMFEKLLFDD